MTIGTNNLEEEMTAIKAMLKRLVKENEEKEARIKLHKEKIARLTKKLEKRLARAIVKSLESGEEKRVSIESEASNEKFHSKNSDKLKNGGSPSLMTVEQI